MSPRRSVRATGGADDGASAADVRFARVAGRVVGAAGGLREDVVFFDKN
jgi:hypothetical protein